MTTSPNPAVGETSAGSNESPEITAAIRAAVIEERLAYESGSTARVIG